MGRKAQERRYQTQLAKLHRRDALGDPTAMEAALALATQRQRQKGRHLRAYFVDAARRNWGNDSAEFMRLLFSPTANKSDADIAAEKAFHAELSKSIDSYAAP